MTWGQQPFNLEEQAPMNRNNDKALKASRMGEIASTSRETRYESLDAARGLAVLGMIYVHFVPAEGATTDLEEFLSGIVRLHEGTPAAMFCILAGMSWAIQSSRAASSRRFSAYVIRRILVLAIAGALFHFLIWPTEILLPLALMLMLSLVLSRAGKMAMLAATVLLLVALPVIPFLFADYVTQDWNADGSHVADSTLGWASLRFLIFDGNYPVVPWMAFPLTGMLLAMSDAISSPRVKIWFWFALPLAVTSQIYAVWAESNSILLGGLTAYLSSTWVPASIPFMLVTGSSAFALITFLMWWQVPSGLPRWATPLTQLGRASLTHYILHICLVFVPLRCFFPEEDWSIRVGLGAFVLYTVLAIPLTMLWFRVFKRGPLEEVWARLSGRAK
jgi:uncharacterized membrane protein YeiB